eukprot:CAMPEP_0206492142 /NCGR_PEP_ID=MMETSP0324_2-20121206/45749_1 /ASSEMBLY_ACC=CAM_ASM_000836 /TAXON_ID=2866 /ORGANISM="Crypthecodinium cohnii, Strain Seligo" /LENGTH=94 /DNA_ID=CAMNT_0053974135 /DNA_START=354 /DNA_END=635 /DNA_ORIENTATION=+
MAAVPTVAASTAAAAASASAIVVLSSFAPVVVVGGVVGASDGAVYNGWGALALQGQLKHRGVRANIVKFGPGASNPIRCHDSITHSDERSWMLS